MKKIIIIFALLLSAVSLTKAQGGKSPAIRAQATVEKLPATLNLSADQKTKLVAIFTAQGTSQDSLKTAMDAAKASGSDMAPFMARRKALSATTNAKVLALLSDEQKTAYKELMKSRQPAAANGAAGKGKKGKKAGGETSSSTAAPSN